MSSKHNFSIFSDFNPKSIFSNDGNLCGGHVGGGWLIAQMEMSQNSATHHLVWSDNIGDKYKLNLLPILEKSGC